MLVDTFINTLVKKKFGKELVPRFARYLIIFPDLTKLFTVTVTNSVAVFLVRTRFQNGFLCDFITSCFSRFLLRI